MGLKSFLINNLLERFLVRFGYISPDTNTDFYFKQKTRQTVVFCIDIILSGILIHFSLFFVYYFLKLQIPLKVQPLLVVSYGLFFHYFMNWLPKPTTKGVKIR